MNTIIKGAKAGSGSARKAVIAPDSAQSKTYIKILYGMSEGKIKGLVNGLQSIYLDDTPLHDANGNPNFENVTVDTRDGSNDQTYIEGFPDISSETAIGVELKSEASWVRAFTNLDLDAVRVRFRFGPLREQNADNGDVNGITIRYAIDVQTDGGTWTEVLNTQISDKTSTNYERSHRIDLPKADFGWQIRVRRLTPNANSEYISDKMYVQAITEVIDAKLRYPNTALLGLQYDAETFSNVAKMAAECEGVEILLPSNYDPVTRTYSGMWNGTFKRAYSNNPAWHFYDTCVAKRYALGDRINSSMIDKWSIYRLAQYCDQSVPDGKGGFEPRFTLNVYEQSQDDAWSVLSKMAGAFRAFIYWDGQAIVCDADMPQDTFFTYTRANVIEGQFEYSGTRARDRHTVAKVAWDNPANRYKTEYVFVRDEAAIARLGIRIVEIAAYGCTSESQAQRAGHWALKSEQYETRTVTFKVGLDGYIPKPGKVIEVADELFAGRANGGRISAVSADFKSITLDRDDVVCRAGDRLIINGENGQAQARIVQSINGRIVTVVAAFELVAAQHVWVIDAQDLATMKFRVISITQDDTHQFTINGLQYNSSKYDAIDHAAFIDERPISIVNPNLQKPVESVAILAETMVQQGLSIETMIIAWPQAEAATKYQVEWRKDDGSWMKLPITGNNSVEIQGIYSGKYEARVTAISAFDVASLPTYSLLTALSGKQGLPPALANLTATGILFGMKLNWNFPAVGALDTAYTEIRIATTSNGANAALLGLFAYPTTTHTIQGLQPNLTQWFSGRLIDRIGNVGPWSAWTSGKTSADASAVLDILSGKITATQLHQDLQTKIDKIDTIAGLDGDIGNLIDNITAVQTEVDQINTALNTETQQRIEAMINLDDSIAQEISDRKSVVSQEITNRVAAITAEAAARTAAIQTEAQQRIAALNLVNDGLSTEISDRKNAVNQEIMDRKNAITAESAARAQDILNEAQRTNTAISTEKNERIDADGALSNRIDTVSASSNSNAAAIQSEATARASADSALGQRIDIVIVEVDNNVAAIQQEAVARADADSTNASLIELVRAESNQNNQDVQALIINESNARISADSALAERVTGVEIVTNPELIGSDEDLIGNQSGYVGAWSILTAVQEGDLYQAQRTDLLTVSVQENAANILTEQTVRIDANKALSQRLDSLDAEFNGNTASVNQKLLSLADADQSLVQDISGMNARVGNNEANITSESQARATGDAANAQALTVYRASNDSALAAVSEKVETVVTESSSNSQLIIALDGRVLSAQETANEAKTESAQALTNSASAFIKAETAITEAGAASSIASQATATAIAADSKANTASSKADTASDTANTANSKANTAIENSATALSTANAAVTESSANATKIDALTLELGDKASTGALSQTDAKVAEIDGKTSANTTKIDGVYAQVNPELIGSDEDLIGSTEGFAGAWSLQSAMIEGDLAQSQRTDSVEAKVSANSASILLEQTARVDADQSLATQIESLESEFADNSAEINTKLSTLTDADSALSARVDTLNASSNSNAAAIQSEATARANADAANTQALTVYKASNDNALAAVSEKVSANTTANSATAGRVDAIDVRLVSAEDDVSEALTNSATAVNKADAAVTQSGSAISTANQATATAIAADSKANAASSKADTAGDTANSANSKANIAIDNSATALSTATAAATESSANATQINALTVELGDKATTGALSQTDAKVAEIEGKTSANTTKIDGVYAQVNPELIGSDEDLIGSTEGFAGAWSIQSAMIEGDLAQSQRTDVVVAQIAENKAAIQSESIARVDADSVTTLRLDKMQSDVDGNKAIIKTEQTTRSNADEALSRRIDTLQSQVGDDLQHSIATIQSELDVLANADSALSTRVDTVQASTATAQSTANQAVLDAQSKSAAAEQAAKTYADAKAKAEADAAIASASSDATSKANAAESVAKAAAALDAKNKADAAQAAATAVANAAQTTATEALNKADAATSSIATVQSEVHTLTTQQSATASQVNTIQTNMGQNTASIQEVSDSVNGLYAQKYLKLDVNGKVAGWGGANDGVEGKFVFNIDTLAIGSGDSVGYYPFIFRTTPFTDPVTGTVFPVSAYLKSAMMDYQSVKTSHIEDLAVKSAQIDDLAVKTAKIDDLAVTGGKIQDLAVSTLKIEDNAVTVPVSAFAEAIQTVGTDYTTIQTLNVPSDMGHTILTFGAVFSFTGYAPSQQILCRVLKNGNVIFDNLEVYFMDYESVGVTSQNSGQHGHSVLVNVNGSASSAGSHSHGFSGTTQSSSAGSVSNSNHSHGFNSSTQSSGDHSHSLNLSASASMGLDGIHSHNVNVRGSARGAGTLNLSRHDSTLIAGTFQLQLRASSGGNINVSQRYIHAMTMRK